MVHKTITIDVADGIKLHEAANIAREMENMDCSCELIYGDKRLNAKSQISIISAGIKKGSEVTFECDGDEEEKAFHWYEDGKGESYIIGKVNERKGVNVEFQNFGVIG